MQIDDLISSYVKLRDKKAEIKSQYDAKVLKIDETLDKIEKVLLVRFRDSGTESAKTEYGTAFLSTRNSCTAADKESFLEFVREKDEWGLLDVRPLKSAVEVFKSEHDDLPPGLNWRSEVVVSVRRSPNS